MGLRAKGSGLKGGENSWARAAVLKALDYKQNQRAEKSRPKSRRRVTGTVRYSRVSIEARVSAARQ
jgi:hypothetical protein